MEALAVRELPEEIRRKLDERRAELRGFIEKETDEFKRSVDELMHLMPVQASVGFLGNTIANLTDLIRKQAEISRKWLERR